MEFPALCPHVRGGGFAEETPNTERSKEMNISESETCNLGDLKRLLNLPEDATLSEVDERMMWYKAIHPDWTPDSIAKAAKQA